MNAINKTLSSAIDTALNHYAPRTKHDWENYQILDWGDHASQLLRFNVLSQNVSLVQKNLLDVGSGLGDLWRFLAEQQKLPGSYTGTDLVEEMVTLAKQQLPHVDIFACNVLEENPQEFLYDVVYASGIFNLRNEDNLGFLTYFLQKIPYLTLKDSTIILNFLNDRAEEQYDHCFYYNSDVIKSIFDEFYEHVQLIDNYLINDFTIIASGRKEM